MTADPTPAADPRLAELTELTEAIYRWRATDHHLSTPEDDARFILALLPARTATTEPTHPHDGYAYDGCVCICCLNVRTVAHLRKREDPTP